MNLVLLQKRDYKSLTKKKRSPIIILIIEPLGINLDFIFISIVFGSKIILYVKVFLTFVVNRRKNDFDKKIWKDEETLSTQTGILRNYPFFMLFNSSFSVDNQ